jgi:cytochrome P450
LRNEDPVHHLGAYDAWAITRMDEVWRCFARPDLFSNAGGITGAQVLQRRMAPFAALGNLDPPVHTERRAAVKGWFTTGRAKALQARMEAVCRSRLDELREREQFDAVVDYGLHLSVTIVCELLDIPVDDRSRLIEWVRQIFYRDESESGLTAAGADAYERIRQYCLDLARARRAAPDRSEQGLLDSYLAMRADGDALLSDDDVASHLREIVIGGSETNPKALAATIHRLATHPDQRAAVAEDPTRAGRAFAEGLRIDTPGQFMGRTVAADTELCGKRLRRGEVALLMIASANRDEREFDAPDTFDVLREPRRAVGFGSGAHFCMGRHVAALEGEVAIQQLLAASPRYEIDLRSARRTTHEMVHGFTSLPVSLR